MYCFQKRIRYIKKDITFGDGNSKRKVENKSKNKDLAEMKEKHEMKEMKEIIYLRMRCIQPKMTEKMLTKKLLIIISRIFHTFMNVFHYSFMSVSCLLRVKQG